MKIKKLRISNFRNLKSIDLSPGPNLNLFLGPNGQGKTSLLEAVGLISSLKSFRGAKAQSLVAHGHDRCFIETETEHAGLRAQQNVEWKSIGNGKFHRTASIHGKSFSSGYHYLKQSLSKSAANFHTVVFSPGDHDLIQGSPATRRSYLDQFLALEREQNLESLARYRRALEQKNSLLKSGVQEGLIELNQILIRNGAQVAYERVKLLQEWIPRIDTKRKILSESMPQLGLFYTSEWWPIEGHFLCGSKDLALYQFTGLSPLPSVEILEQYFAKKLKTLESEEFRRGQCLVGIHRDDWGFWLNEPSQELKDHGSQGEVRSALLALKLSELEIFHERTEREPIFLLDDFSSELDRKRRENLVRYLESMNYQVWITSTESPWSGHTISITRELKIFEVNHGLVNEKKE